MQLTDTQMIWGKSLQTIVDAISFFQIFGPMSPLKVSMTNDWTYRAGGQIDLDGFEKIIPKPIMEFLRTFIKDLTWGSFSD